MGIGFSISMVTVFVTSLLISRFNIILAIRNLPKPVIARAAAALVGGRLPRHGARPRPSLGASVPGENSIGMIAGPALHLLLGDAGAGPGAAPKRIVVPVLASSSWYGAAPVQPGPRGRWVEPVDRHLRRRGPRPGAAAIVVFASFDRVWLRACRAASSPRRPGGLPARLGLAYPLARRFRTGAAARHVHAGHLHDDVPVGVLVETSRPRPRSSPGDRQRATTSCSTPTPPTRSRSPTSRPSRVSTMPCRWCGRAPASCPGSARRARSAA